MILDQSPEIRAERLSQLLSLTPVSPGRCLRTAREAFERSLILRTIQECGGDKQRAAKALGIGIASLYRKLDSTTD